MDACPKCGGRSGYRFEMTETHVMFGDWGQHAEAGDSGLNVKRTMPRCEDCGHRFQWDKFKGEDAAPKTADQQEARSDG